MKMIMTILILILMACVVFGVGVYTPPDNHNVTLELPKDYIVDDSHNISLVVEPVTEVAPNNAPTITGVGPIANVDLIPGSVKAVAINYSVEDTNGIDDINVTSLKVYVTKSGETDRVNTSGNCVTSGSGNLLFVTCNVPMEYYDGAGAWDVNVTANDDSGLYADDKSVQVTVNSLDDIQLNDTALTCGTLSSPSSDNKCDVEAIQNIGNTNYSYVCITGYDLDDDTTGLVKIDVNNFNMNVTDSPGFALQNNSALNISNAIGNVPLYAGDSSEMIIYTYVDVPTGKISDTYSSQSNWILEPECP